MTRSILGYTVAILLSFHLATSGQEQQQTPFDDNQIVVDVKDGVVIVDPYGYGHVSPLTLRTLEINLLAEQEATGKEIELPEGAYVPPVPTCSVWNECREVAIYLVKFQPALAQSAIKLSKRAAPPPQQSEDDHSANVYRVRPTRHPAEAEPAQVADKLLATERADPMLGFIYLVVLMAFYWIPWVVSRMRHHHDSGAIFVVNLFFGWTGIGWIIALVWAMTGNVPRPMNVNVTVSDQRRRGWDDDRPRGRWDDGRTIDASPSDPLAEPCRRSRGFITGAE
jgi:Superinfection immunity protein